VVGIGRKGVAEEETYAEDNKSIDRASKQVGHGRRKQSIDRASKQVGHGPAAGGATLAERAVSANWRGIKSQARE
jgi:hypothetical protein